MALGGGTYVTQNKVLPGAYFQFISASKASASLSERGVVGMGLELNWGTEGKIFDVTKDDFIKNSLEIFGYESSADEMKNIRDIFAHATLLHAYMLTSGGTKASCAYATAKSCGTRGNDLKVVIQANVDNDDAFDVSLYLDTLLIDKQTVESAATLVDNAFITYKKDATLAVTAGTSLTGGTNSTVDATAHQAFLNKIEAYPDTNAIGYTGDIDTIKATYIAFAKRMREEVGINLQTVVYNKAADSIACVNVKNSTSLVYWATGVVAGTAVNKSATNMVYDGEATVSTDYTQKQLEAAITNGEWVLHQVGNEIHVLEDINSLVTVTDEQGEVFKDNQTVRVIDAIASSVASVFASKYIGKVPNNQSGRVSLWSDIVSIHQNLADMGAIDEFDPNEITVEQGEAKKSIAVNSSITVVNTMTKLYMRTVIA